MKKFRIFMILALIVGCLAVAVGCGSNALSSPGHLKIDQDTLVLTWQSVPGAVYYRVKINEQERIVEEGERSYSLEGLTEGEYDVAVKAIGSDNEESDWSSPIHFIREHETGLTFSLINGGTEYAVSGFGNAGENVVVPDEYRGRPVTKIGDKAFQNNWKLVSIALGDNVTSIGTEAFNNCSYLEDIEISSGVTEIGARAFQGCSLLESVVVPETVTVIDDGTFQYCRGLKNFQFGEKVTSIGNDAFDSCESLETIEIPDSVQIIGDNAFSRCGGLKKVVLGSGVLMLGTEAFRQDEMLEEVVFDGDGVLQLINSYAFAECEKLTSVNLPESVRIIGSYCFYNCAALAEIEAGDGIEQILQGAFTGTAYLENAADEVVYLNQWLIDVKDTELVEIPVREGTVGIGSTAFRGCKKLTQLILPDSVKIIGSGAFLECESLISVVIGSGVETLGTQAFYKCEKLFTVILGSYDFENQTLIESCLKTISPYAFMGCSSLSEIEIPETVTQIGTYAFRDTKLYNSAVGGVVYADNWLVDCNNDRVAPNVVVREGTVAIADYAFYQCEDLQTVTISDSVETIGEAAFYGCTGLVRAELPSGLKRIEDYTFYNCFNLNAVSFPEGLAEIGRSAFYQCKLLRYEIEEGELVSVLTFPDSLKTIGDYAFFSCGYLMEPEEGASDEAQAQMYGFEEIRFGNGVTNIGYCAFYQFISLKRVDLGAKLETIGEKAFYRCDRLEEVTGGGSVRSIGQRAFYQCVSLNRMTIPDAVAEIADYAFYGCKSLTEVSFGQSVENIGRYAFYGCEGLTDIAFPASLRTIGSYAFRYCKALESVLIGKDVRSVGMHAFYGCNQLTVYAEGYAQGAGWHPYWNSSYRPIVWGCTLSENDGYVVSIEVGEATFENVSIGNVVAAPFRAGYDFVGWALSSNNAEVAYVASELQNAPMETQVYAVWKEATENSAGAEE